LNVTLGKIPGQHAKLLLEVYELADFKNGSQKIQIGCPTWIRTIILTVFVVAQCQDAPVYSSVQAQVSKIVRDKVYIAVTVGRTVSYLSSSGLCLRRDAALRRLRFKNGCINEVDLLR
jgi:uncharacterized membrane protein (DUF441 family)